MYELHIDIEARYHVHVATLSNVTAAYKVMGAASILPKYFNDTRDPLFAAQVTIGHNRYSTNTLSSFFRVQPFSLLGHNGEINTVKKMRIEADMIGIPLVDGGSDSQDMNRTIETFIHRFGLSLFEAMELVFPPIINEMKQFRPELQDLYVYYRQVWGHYAQGPAGIVSRYGNECIFSVDALGLRPVWMVESDTSLYFSSEQGVITVGDMVADPKPIAPGEKVGVVLTPGEHVQVIPYHEVQNIVLNRASQRTNFSGLRKHLAPHQFAAVAELNETLVVTDPVYSAFGWDREGIQMIETMSETGAEPIRSLGHDGPHAALNWERQNIPDFIKESVAVVTNPAIDRDREMEHFSTRIIAGIRPVLYQELDTNLRIELLTPLVLEGPNGVDSEEHLAQPSYEQLLAVFRAHSESSVAIVSTTFEKGTSLSQGLDALTANAIAAVKNGASLLVLDDSEAHQNNRLWMDPHLAVSKLDIALRAEKLAFGDNLRRHVTIVLRSASIRSLHDIAVACGLGADVISPYLLFATASGKEDAASAARKVYSAITKGLEKAISTIGTHELRGYTRFFSSIGFHPEVAEVLDIVNYLGSEKAGTGFIQLQADAEARYNDYTNPKAKAARNFKFFQRMWKSLNEAASGTAPYSDYRDKLREEEIKNPISIRHVAGFNVAKALADGLKPLNPSEVDISVGNHDLPMLISSMSFGSQNETAFRAYAEAGERLNMVTMNGEGGEIKDMLGRYKKTRGAQVASGRFGINIELANAVAFLEIKIGQGAKPGEGGHLPGSKVTAKIAAARNATIGSDLISPSNNHDIYSIEDLAQIISELKEASGRKAKIIVKVPIVPGIGTIAVGVAKAGADIITLSGFDGGTGAARIHSLTHVGLPTEIGTKLAHVALIEAGLRHRVELWSDGGLKSGADVVKMIMLGANRCGFGSISMQAIGCTTCRGCHLDTCHVGIATQIDSKEEADEKGLRRFVPREFDLAVNSLVRLFGAMGEEIREIVAQLGFKSAQDLVGRSDLLEQISHLEKIDLSDILRPAPLQLITAEEAEVVGNISTSDIQVAAGAEGQDFYPETLSFDAPVQRTWSNVNAETRILGSRFSSHRVRDRFDGSYDQLPGVSLNLLDGSVPGIGLAAFNARGVDITVHGGAEDGVAKMSFGGKVAILKSPGKNNTLINGSVGKSFGYGSQKGLFLIQGNADTRACIRFSGADVVFGGEITTPLQDELGSLASRANLKGFAFEYMTNGRAVVMGDPGPWICAGMTGGVIYQRLVPEMGFDIPAIERRVAKGAKVKIEPIGAQSKKDLTELLTAYHSELAGSNQAEAAAIVADLLNNLEENFVRIAPVGLQADQSVATE
ncbi:Glutamate synthase [NADPH] large chain [compost metagenome]